MSDSDSDCPVYQASPALDWPADRSPVPKRQRRETTASAAGPGPARAIARRRQPTAAAAAAAAPRVTRDDCYRPTLASATEVPAFDEPPWYDPEYLSKAQTFLSEGYEFSAADEPQPGEEPEGEQIKRIFARTLGKKYFSDPNFDPYRNASEIELYNLDKAFHAERIRRIQQSQYPEEWTEIHEFRFPVFCLAYARVLQEIDMRRASRYIPGVKQGPVVTSMPRAQPVPQLPTPTDLLGGLPALPDLEDSSYVATLGELLAKMIDGPDDVPEGTPGPGYNARPAPSCFNIPGLEFDPYVNSLELRDLLDLETKFRAEYYQRLPLLEPGYAGPVWYRWGWIVFCLAYAILFRAIARKTLA